MESLVIREAEPADVNSILDLYHEAGIESEDPFNAEEGRNHFGVFACYPSYRIFVAAVDDTIIATYALLIMDNLAKHGRRSAIVEDVAVSPAHQRKGVGRAIMHHAMQESRKADCYKLVVSSALGRTHAHAMYQSIGFSQHGISFRVDL